MKIYAGIISLFGFLSRFMRVARICFLLAIVVAIFDSSAGDLLISDAAAVICERPGQTGCTTAPEIPAMLLPFFILASVGTFYFVRRRNLTA